MIKKFNEMFDNKGKINEDWGSSDQAIMNNTIHRDLGEPETMPMPFDDELRSAAEEAVDFHWEDWTEYNTNRDDLIDKAIHSYYRAYFPEKYAKFKAMFSPK